MTLTVVLHSYLYPRRGGGTNLLRTIRTYPSIPVLSIAIPREISQAAACLPASRELHYSWLLTLQIRSFMVLLL